MRGQNDFWITVFIAVLLQDSLLAIVNSEDATTKKSTKQTSSHGGNTYNFFSKRNRKVTSNFYIYLFY